MIVEQYDYEKFAKYYDLLELDSSIGYNEINAFLEQLFKDFNVKEVVDFTCGTGSQSLYFAKQGYKIVASDLSKEMLKIAKQKAKLYLTKNTDIKFKHGDIRTSQFGEFDAAISIFNSIGHLSKEDLGKALRNVANNLKPKGLYIFDIFNFDFMKKYKGFGFEFIDCTTEYAGKKYVRLNHNSLDKKRKVMHINQRVYVQEGFGKPDILRESWDMKIYGVKDLEKLVSNNGFELYQMYGKPGEPFYKDESSSIWVVATKK